MQQFSEALAAYAGALPTKQMSVLYALHHPCFATFGLCRAAGGTFVFPLSILNLVSNILNINKRFRLILTKLKLSTPLRIQRGCNTTVYVCFFGRVTEEDA